MSQHEGKKEKRKGKRDKKREWSLNYQQPINAMRSVQPHQQAFAMNGQAPLQTEQQAPLQTEQPVSLQPEQQVSAKVEEWSLNYQQPINAMRSVQPHQQAFAMNGQAPLQTEQQAPSQTEQPVSLQPEQQVSAKVEEWSLNYQQPINAMRSVQPHQQAFAMNGQAPLQTEQQAPLQTEQPVSLQPEQQVSAKVEEWSLNYQQPINAMRSVQPHQQAFAMNGQAPLQTEQQAPLQTEQPVSLQPEQQVSAKVEEWSLNYQQPINAMRSVQPHQQAFAMNGQAPLQTEQQAPLQTEQPVSLQPEQQVSAKVEEWSLNYQQPINAMRSVQPHQQAFAMNGQAPLQTEQQAPSQTEQPVSLQPEQQVSAKVEEWSLNYQQPINAMRSVQPHQQAFAMNGQAPLQTEQQAPLQTEQPVSLQPEQQVSAKVEGINSTDPRHSKKVNPALTQAFDMQVRPYIDLIDNLRAYGLDKDVGLPAVAVIGDQSSGKSSTLEAISGIQLPRGSGIVTRCPLELRLKCDRGDEHVWSGTISYLDSEKKRNNIKLTSPEAVEEAVKEAQNAMTDGELGISDELISLEIVSAEVPDLTLIDLPGIARVPVDDQPIDICSQIKRLINKYIRKQETIILVVIPCNVDIATTEALQLSRDIDKGGERSLGVLTKPDLIDKGAEAQVLKAVNNLVIPLKKGYTMVKCRGQAAVEEKQTLQAAMDEEKEFFETHQKFSVLPQQQRGIPSLAKRLTDELVEQIKKVVPDLKNDVKQKLQETREKLRDLGEGLPKTEEGRQGVLLEIISNFNSQLEGLSTGDYSRKQDHYMRLLTEARKKFDVYGACIKHMAPNETDSTLMADIKKQIQDHRGRELPNFIMYPVFEALVRDVIQETEDPGLQCLNDVDRIVERVLDQLCCKYFTRFPQILGDVKNITANLRISAKSTCEEELKKQFEMETLIYTQDKTYLKEMDRISAKRAEETVEKVPFYKKEKEDRDMKASEARLVLDALTSYFDVASRRIIDMVPMIIRHQMLVVLIKKISRETVKFGANLENAKNVLEDPRTDIRREELRDRKQRLVKAEMDLNRF